jgi:hypothetical protein
VSKRTHNTLKIEALIKTGASVSSISREAGVSRQRVQHIKKRLLGQWVSGVQVAVQPPEEVAGVDLAIHSSGMATPKALTLHLMPAVYDALTEACAISNRQNPDDTISITEYIEELVINRVVELGLLKRHKRK